MVLVGIIGGDDVFNEFYENLFRDILGCVENYFCLMLLIMFKILLNNY